jgi:hypothetical protein
MRGGPEGWVLHPFRLIVVRMLGTVFPAFGHVMSHYPRRPSGVCALGDHRKLRRSGERERQYKRHPIINVCRIDRATHLGHIGLGDKKPLAAVALLFPGLGV